MSLDEDKRRLERRASAGQDPLDVTRAQANNDRAGLSADDADYLIAYLDLCNRALADSDALTDLPSRDKYDIELAALNETYSGRVGSKTLRASISTLVSYDQGFNDGSGWATSQSC